MVVRGTSGSASGPGQIPGATQMFIGVYAPKGFALYEEAFDSRPGESMTRALAWGVGRARRIAEEEVQICEPIRLESLR